MAFLDGGGWLKPSQNNRPASVTQSTTTNAPWKPAQPYLKEIMSGAQDVFQGAAPSYFPDTAVVPFAPQTEQALRMTEERALGGSQLRDEAQAQALATLQGQGVGQQNPFLSGAYQAATRPMVEQWQNQIAPGIESQFAGSGRLGSGAHAQVRNTSEDTLARALSETAAQMGYKDYSKERGYQQSMIGQAEGLAAGDYADIGQLMGVGGAREGMEQARLQDEMNRFNFEQNRPWEQLGKYSGIIGGGFGMETTQANPLYSNPAANFLGGAMGGAQLGSYFGQPGMGAAAGGILGMFG